jgi:ribosomal protein S14
LKGGESRQCSACGRRPRGYVDKLPLVSWNRLLTNAKKRGISIAITRDDAAALLDRQKDRCALSGLPIATRRDGTIAGDRATTASLDRIDSDKGYMPDNVQWVHKEINMMKGVLTQARFVELCRAVLDYQAQR